MKPTSIILYNHLTEPDAAMVKKKYLIDRMIFSENLELSVEILEKILEISSDFFYIIKIEEYTEFRNFNFTYTPPPWDAHYVNVWNNDTRVRLFNTALVKLNPSQYTDRALQEGMVKLKSIDSIICYTHQYDTIFISYDEPLADVNFSKLTKLVPGAKRVTGVKGIINAHMAAANLSDTDMFFVIDADADVLDSFNFGFRPDLFNKTSSHVWYSRNPVNGLEYGYGGIKLFPKTALLKYKESPIDFTTSVTDNLVVIPQVSNITRFNTDPFSTWRSAFRECAKLSSKSIVNQHDIETDRRLDIWCTVSGDVEFGDFSVEGANAGRKFGVENANKQELKLINDFSWLEYVFSNS